MKLKIKKYALLNALNDVSKAISTKNIIPILSGIVFELKKDKLILLASDNDITIQTYIEAGKDLEINNTGSIVIKGKYILDIIKKLEDEWINIETIEEHKVIIYTKNSEFNLNGTDFKEYPSINFDLSTDFVNIKVNELKNFIMKTNYACSLDEARLVLTGINLKGEGNYLECSATDSYRLSLIKMKLKDSIKNSFDIIIPSKNINELIKILPDDNSDVEIYIFNNKIIFKFENILFQSRLINGTYPNTKNLIPSENLFDIKLNKNEFYNMVDRASILNNDKDNNVISLEINEKDLKITSMSLEIGKVEEKMVIDCDKKIKISFNSKYMLDAIRTIKNDNIIISFVGEIKPILLKEEDNEDLVCLILPIRTY